MNTTIVLGIISSILATFILTIFGFLWGYAKSARIQRIILRLLNVGIYEVFENRAVAEKNLYEDNSETSKLKVLTNRGLPFVEPSISKHPVSSWENVESAQMLLINPESEGAKRRAKDIGKLANPNWHESLLNNDIYNVAKRAAKTLNVDLRYHNEESIFRLVITDKYAYISGFLPEEFGKDLPVYKVTRSSFLYRIFNRYFELAWLNSSPPSIPTDLPEASDEAAKQSGEL